MNYIDKVMKEFDENYPNHKGIKCFIWRVLTEQEEYFKSNEKILEEIIAQQGV